jgi:hypothetical protein
MCRCHGPQSRLRFQVDETAATGRSAVMVVVVVVVVQ